MIFFARSDSRFSNTVQTKHQCKAYLFSFQMMHKSQFPQIDSYDWFCAPWSLNGAHLCFEGAEFEDHFHGKQYGEDDVQLF